MSRRHESDVGVLGAITAFLHDETVGAAVLLVATVAAVAWANSPVAASYEAFWRTVVEVRLAGDPVISLDLRHWVNDALMALFFFVVGLEIKRELVEGELRSREKAVLPGIAALGGMAVPASIYLTLNSGGDAARGWGIPMATDIAFAVGVLSLFSRRVPRGLIVFLLALAIADDIGAILVIAVFYTEQLDPVAIGVALAALALVLVLWRIELHWTDPPLVLLMLIVWAATLASGVHATIAGVALGLLAPVASGAKEMGVAERLEETFHPWTSRIVIPVFALANAGVAMEAGEIGSAIGSGVGAGVILGLVVGKPVGILGASFLAVRSGVARLPSGVHWRPLAGAAALAGIGFTVSLFIAQLGLSDAHLSQAKVGIFVGSVAAAAIGSAFLLFVTEPRRA